MLEGVVVIEDVFVVFDVDCICICICVGVGVGVGWMLDGFMDVGWIGGKLFDRWEMV